MDLFNKILDKHNHHPRKHHAHYDGHEHHHHHRHHQDNPSPSGHTHGRVDERHRLDGDETESNVHSLLQQLIENKRAIGILLLLAAILIVLVVGALILLFPVMLKMAELAGEEGVAGTFAQAMTIARLRLSAAR